MLIIVKAVVIGLAFQAAILLQAIAGQIPTELSRAESLRSIGLDNARRLESEARRKTAIVLTGASVQPTTITNDSINVLISAPDESESHVGVALASAIDRRGYFLTAAHVAADEPLSLVFWDGKQLHAMPARVVAKLSCLKHEAETKLDVALLHVDAELSEVFQWADLSNISRSDFLFQIGRTIHRMSDTNGIVGPEAFVGKFKKMINLRGGGTALRMETPARRGDSGGPVITLEGKLLGIECGFVRPFLRGAYELANRPDMKWLREAMDVDIPSSREPIAAGGELHSGESLMITVPLLLQ